MIDRIGRTMTPVDYRRAELEHELYHILDDLWDKHMIFEDGFSIHVDADMAMRIQEALGLVAT